MLGNATVVGAVLVPAAVAPARAVLARRAETPPDLRSNAPRSSQDPTSGASAES
jgi:hypothetical protein